MSKCTICGVNFVGVPELPLPEGVCVRCDNKRLRAELDAAKAEIARLDMCECPHCGRVEAENARLAAALSTARLQTISLREAGHAAMRTDYAAEAVGDINEGDAAAFYVEGFEAAVKEIRKANPATALRDLLGPFLDRCDILVRYQGKDGHRDWASASTWLMPGDAIADISETELARLRAVIEKHE